jgi:threonine synthase
VKYVSTRGTAPVLEFGDVLLAGLARDGGLYVPESWPPFAPDRLASFADLPYAEVAVEVMWPFVEGAIERDEFADLVIDAYASFDHPDVVPLRDLGQGLHLMELFHGPTLAFKDVPSG